MPKLKKPLPDLIVVFLIDAEKYLKEYKHIKQEYSIFSKASHVSISKYRNIVIRCLFTRYRDINKKLLAGFLNISYSTVAVNSTIDNNNGTKSKIIIPWFAVMFIVVVAFNSFDLLSLQIVESINYLDSFILTVAMTALGMQTSFDKFKNVGLKPIYLASVLFLWLIFAGYFIVSFLFS